MKYDEKRYRIAPWKGTYGDARHAVKLHGNLGKIREALEERKKELRRVQEQIRQLEMLESSAGSYKSRVLDGVVVKEMNGLPHESDFYTISLVSRAEWRSGKIYPNAHNKGATWGVNIHEHHGVEHREMWLGDGHTREQAIEAAQAWVTRGEIGTTKRVVCIDGVISARTANWY